MRLRICYDYLSISWPRPGEESQIREQLGWPCDLPMFPLFAPLAAGRDSVD